MFKIFRLCVVALASFTVVAVALGGAARADMGWDYDWWLVRTTEPGATGTLGDQFFHLDWTVDASSQGQSTITGYVYNDYGQPAQSVQLQITGVDGSGRAIESVIRPVRGLVPGLGRAYFEVRVPDAQSYRVSVASFDFLEFPGTK